MIDFSPMNSAVLSTFGQRVTVLRAAGGTVVLKGIFDNEYVETADINGTHPVLTVATEDLAGVSVGDSYLIDSVTYTIRVPAPDTEGLTKLISERVP